MMIITDSAIQRLAERHEVQLVAQALDIPPSEVARDMLQPVPCEQIYDTLKCAGAEVHQAGRVPVWSVMWQCRAIPQTHNGFTYLRIGMSLN